MLKDALLAEFDHEIATTRRLLERVPDDKLLWAPHPKSRPIGALGSHLVSIPAWTGHILNGTVYDLTAFQPNADLPSREDILAAFQTTSGQARGWMDRTDAEYLAMWTLKRAGQEVFSIPRVAAFRSFVFNHLIHHRGQLSVYLRLLDIPVPAIYGPTADEG
jgi:uncharacterized damage-inducible protein DinB